MKIPFIYIPAEAKRVGNDNTALTTGQITFMENHLPPLQAGDYLITVAQQLQNQNPSDPQIDEQYVNTRRFVVRGERFTLDPGEVNALFPPANNQGEYSNVLPHVVLSRRTLPWERTPDGTEAGTPWLALLLFEAEDPAPLLQNAQVGDLLRAPFYRKAGDKVLSPSTLLTDAVSYPDAFAKPGRTFELEYGEATSDNCQVIDVPVALFGALAPSLADLKWLAHARRVSRAKKAGERSEGETDYAVVVANRLPAPNKTCTAHLVSLEGLASYLPTGDDYSPASITLADGSPAQTIRLVSLQSWSFTSVDPKETFTGYLEQVDLGALQLPVTGTPTSGAEQAVANALTMGYTAAPHQTRLGDQTVSWYRGPFIPFAAPSVNVPVPITTADQGVHYNPETGLMDVSYAAAWQLGRLLALQNQSYSISLYNWKRANAQTTVLALEQATLQEKLGTVLGVSESDLKAQGVAALHKAAAGFLTTRLAPHLVPHEGGGDA